MENSSKALIIAGTILIVMMMIAVGMHFFASTGKVSSSAQSKWSQDEILSFNSQFIKYQGTQKGSYVKELIQAVNRNNERSEVKVSINDKYVNTSNNLFYAKANLINGSTYEVTFGYEDGVIKIITIK